jgi:hypothetical protein
MKTHSKCTPAAIVVVVASLMTAMLQPAAFGRSRDEAPQSEERVVENAVPVVLPNRPVLTRKVAAASVTWPTQTPLPAVQTIHPPDAPVPQQSKGKSRKWIIIVAAAGAAGVAAILLHGGDDNPSTPTPTIVVGVPTVGQPQ